MMSMRSHLIGAAVAGLLASSVSPAFAEIISFKADLKAESVQPPTYSRGTGSLTATYDTTAKTLAWTLSYSGLTGNATGAHFQGPIGPDGKMSRVPDIVGILLSPVQGSATLTDAQAAELTAGRWYVNIETAANPKGEIRGQVQRSR
jgi:hypothetical protein